MTPSGGPVTVHFDGASVAGRAAWGFTVDGAGLDHEACGRVLPRGGPPGSPDSTNNVAEYTAAVRALEYLRERGYRGPVEMLGDSQLVVRQFRGEYTVRAAHLLPLFERLQDLARGFERVSFEWVPRELNRRADSLSKEGLHVG